MGIFMDSSHHGDFGRKDEFSKSGEENREGEIFEEIVIVLQEFDVERKALRVIPRGKQWLTVYRAHQVLITKIKISQNLCVRFTPGQFSDLP